jgi:formate dehydrogenase alpha subunit
MLDMGVCPEYLPGYHHYDHTAAAFGAAWNATVPTVPGKDLFLIIDAIEAGQIKALYVMGSDPLHFLPNRDRVQKALQKLELLIVQDLFSTDTAKLANVVLPAATGSEKAGSFTSVDNRVQCFTAALKPTGTARTDAHILQTLYGMLAPNSAKAAQSLDALHHEITALTGLYSETCDHDGCRMGRIKSRVGKAAAFVAVSPATIPTTDKAYPFNLSVGAVLHHNGSVTLQSENNVKVSEQGYVVINPADAAAAGITEGTTITVSSVVGSVTVPARLSNDVQPGALFVPAHFHETQAGLLLTGATNMVAVKLEKS